MIRLLTAGLAAAAVLGSAVLFAVDHHAWFVALEMDAFGVLVLGSLAFERRYRTRPEASGANWQATGERFADPTTGELLEVRYDPNTGERAYVPAGSMQGRSLPE